MIPAPTTRRPGCGALAAAILLSLTTADSARSQTAPGQHSFLQFVKTTAKELRKDDRPPESLSEWRQQCQSLRAKLTRAWGGFPAASSTLQPQVKGTLRRDGYRIEKIVFQTLQDVWMTANAYVPDTAETKARLPAVLCVHGHWSGAKQDPHVQARCIGLAKLGFFVLAVDAFGAGERGLGKALGEYHGEMVAATLWPTGFPLSGIQVVENRRAVDYLLTRPEVDPERLGITGASGGGNQTMYAGAFDERLKAVVPVCSVGNYQAYLGAACCMCEVVPGALQFTEEWGVLALTAPRALMVVSASQDAFQFSVDEAAESVAGASHIYELYSEPTHLRHAIFESPHDYNQPMREAMYGWMTRHLKEEGDGSPIPEPSIETEDPEILRCFPKDSRPDQWLTLPQYAATVARRQLKARSELSDVDEWQRLSSELRSVLNRDVLGGTEPIEQPTLRETGDAGSRIIHCVPEPGISLTVHETAPQMPRSPIRTVIALNFEDDAASGEASLLPDITGLGHRLITVELRATGKQAWPRDRIGRAADHNTAEWSLWLGRPLLGQWVQDVRAVVSAISQHDKKTDVCVVATGPAGVVALCAAAVDDRINEVIVIGSLASYVSDVPYQNQRLGTIPNGVLSSVGDIAHIAAMIAPRRLTIAGAVSGTGETLPAGPLQSEFSFTRAVYADLHAADQLTLMAQPTASDVANVLSR
ncbi:MAG: alpha/beta hydrolase family protein [Fuerstiella sp.]